MRANLKQARKDKGMTQQAMADELGVSLRHYQRLEDGQSAGGIALWDNLEDLTGTPQRILRETKDIHHGKEDSRQKR